ncbi:M20/M25/M40 family metallo-hydrolase [Hyalangium rubrum]|uniref:M20/M25/M40 family metallo-hydrolase n=1 Tax=Hyalangium rubrum TaxID=3103134 RepID=A0ABU5H0G9_9BACT|nr:M20/M25/M40 family metallo-hydrolase [Hyalangium sp. s54d21]MDY7226258.1 M20/M25/M40 family metallo-hydrolase [Hyalangium sp. s54d21]
MGLKKFAPAALLLWGVTPVMAHAQVVPGIEQPAVDRELWISIGAEALEPVQSEFRAAGFEPPVGVQVQNDLAMMKVHESQLHTISRVMHDKYNRCAGFLAHESEQEARAALTKAGSPTPPIHTQVTYSIDNAGTVNALMSEMAEPNIRATIGTLSSYTTRYYTSATGLESANWIKTTWQNLAAGRSDVSVTTFAHSGYNQPSVILTITGTSLPNEVVVLGGHLDSTNTSGGAAPGADDDASGIASLTEIIRSAMVKGYRPARTVKFMGYAAEEVGLRGSQAIAQWHKTNQVNVVGVLQLDMTNYRGSSVDIGLVTDNTNAAQNSFLTSVIDTYQIATWATTVCGYGCSDHASWHAQGFPASMPFEALMNQHNSAIHSTGDTLARSAGSATHAVKFSKLGAAFMAELAKGTVSDDTGDTTPPMAAITAPAPGATVSGTTTAMANAADNVGVSRVDFLVDGALKGTDNTSPYTFAWDTTSVGNGSHVLVVKAYDASGNVGTSAGVTVNVSNTSTTATYDPTLKAPKCATVNSVCDSGLSLLNGRANLGPEVNKPNTIGGTCADGTQGVYHSDESNDRIRVLTTDGTPFAAGKTVRIEATVWAYSTYTSDKLDLYYAANANAPSWVFLGTYTPTKAGSQVLSATYALPAGGLQAVRANFRYGGTAGTCAAGSYTDHDDLIFAVTP